MTQRLLRQKKQDDREKYKLVMKSFSRIWTLTRQAIEYSGQIANYRRYACVIRANYYKLEIINTVEPVQERYFFDLVYKSIFRVHGGPCYVYEHHVVFNSSIMHEHSRGEKDTSLS